MLGRQGIRFRQQLKYANLATCSKGLIVVYFIVCWVGAALSSGAAVYIFRELNSEPPDTVIWALTLLRSFLKAFIVVYLLEDKYEQIKEPYILRHAQPWGREAA